MSDDCTTRPSTAKERQTNLAHFEEALKIVKTGQDSQDRRYIDLGILNQAAWIGEHSGVLIDEIKDLRSQRDELAQRVAMLESQLSMDSLRLDWLDLHCSFVADCEYCLGPFKVGQLRELADAGLGVDNACAALAKQEDKR